MQPEKTRFTASAFAFASVVFAAAPGFAAHEADCAAGWQELDVNNDGMLTGAEDKDSLIARFEQRGRRPLLIPGRLSREEFLSRCKEVAQDTLTTAPAIPPRHRSPAADSAAINPEGKALSPGANSFTASQAKARLEAFGFSGVGALTKDDAGIWRTTAVKDGRRLRVGMDYRGNIVGE